MINLLILLLQIPILTSRMVGFLIVAGALIYIAIAIPYLIWKASKGEWEAMMVHIIAIFVLGVLAWAGMYIGS